MKLAPLAQGPLICGASSPLAPTIIQLEGDYFNNHKMNMRRNTQPLLAGQRIGESSVLCNSSTLASGVPKESPVRKVWILRTKSEDQLPLAIKQSVKLQKKKQSSQKDSWNPGQLFPKFRRYLIDPLDGEPRMDEECIPTTLNKIV